MKTRILSIIISCLVLLAACKKDGTLFKVLGMDSSQLASSETAVVLTKSTASTKVLAITWGRSALSPSDTSYGVPGSVPKEIIEVSATNDFAKIITITPTDVTYAFTGLALNTLGKNIGFSSGVSTPMYFRINSALGVNTKAYYSNVITVNVTCYTNDMTIGFILDSPKKLDTGMPTIDLLRSKCVEP